MLFLWCLWVVLAALAIGAGRSLARAFAPLLVGTGIATGFVLAYATITMRYTVDLWPLIATLATLGIVSLVPKLASSPAAPNIRVGLLLTLVVSFGASAGVAADYRSTFWQLPNSFSQVWSEADCRERAEAKGLPVESIAHVCRAPRAEAAGRFTVNSQLRETDR